MLCRMIAIVATYLLSCTSALAQDVCATTVDLQRMFNTLQIVAQQRATPTSEQVGQLASINARYSTFSVDWSFRGSAQSIQIANIFAAYDASADIIADLETGRPLPLRLATPRTTLTLNRGLSELARLDCPPPLGNANQQAATTATLRSATPLTETQQTGFSFLPGKIYAVIIFCILFALAIAAFIFNEFRQVSLRKRFTCNIPVNYALPEKPPRAIIATIEDISRGGLKIKAQQGDIPKQGAWVSLQFGGEKQTIRIQWSNAHFFGGQFPKPFSVISLRQLLGSHKASARTRKKPKK